MVTIPVSGGGHVMTEQQNRNATEMIRVTPEVHQRIKGNCRDGETQSGAIHRAFDALERESELPDAVTEAMGDQS